MPASKRCNTPFASRSFAVWCCSGAWHADYMLLPLGSFLSHLLVQMAIWVIMGLCMHINGTGPDAPYSVIHRTRGWEGCSNNAIAVTSNVTMYQMVRERCRPEKADAGARCNSHPVHHMHLFCCTLGCVHRSTACARSWCAVRAAHVWGETASMSLGRHQQSPW